MKIWRNTIAIEPNLKFLSYAPLSPAAFQVYAANSSFNYVNALLYNTYLAEEQLFASLMERVEAEPDSELTLRLAMLHPNIPDFYLEKYFLQVPYLVISNKNATVPLLIRAMQSDDEDLRVLAAIHINAPIEIAAPILLGYWNKFSSEEPLKHIYKRLEASTNNYLLSNGYKTGDLAALSLHAKLELVAQ